MNENFITEKLNDLMHSLNELEKRVGKLENVSCAHEWERSYTGGVGFPQQHCDKCGAKRYYDPLTRTLTTNE